MMHIYASVSWVYIASGNGFSSAITWTSAGLLSIGLLGMNFSEIWIRFYHFHLRKCILKCCLPNWWPFCPGADELTFSPWTKKSLSTITFVWMKISIWRILIQYNFVVFTVIQHAYNTVQCRISKKAPSESILTDVCISSLCHNEITLNRQ